MSDKFVTLPALISPTSPIYYFLVDENGRAFRVADLATDERAKQEERDRLKILMRDAIIRDLESRASNIDQFPYATRPVGYRQIINKNFDINGVNITLRGDEPSIRAAINVLRTYPPKGPVYLTDDGKENFIDLSSLICSTSDSKSVPPVGMIKKSPNDSHITVIMNDKQKFSGSGSLLLLANQDLAKPFDYTKIFIPLFRDVNTGYYASLGGRIDEPDGSNEKDLTLNILYNNARRESREESAGLIQIDSDKQTDDLKRQYIDIDSPKTLDSQHNKYRSYIYYVRIPNAIRWGDFKKMYVQNASKIRRDSNFDSSYHETNDVEFISLARLIIRTSEIIGNSNVVDFATYMTESGIPIRVRDRTVKILAKLFEGIPGARPKLEMILNSRINSNHTIESGINVITF